MSSLHCTHLYMVLLPSVTSTARTHTHTHSVYTMQLLIECKLYLSRELSPAERRAFNFTELGKRALGESGKWAVNLSVVGCNLGVCAAYMIFISNNLRVSCGGKPSHTYM